MAASCWTSAETSARWSCTPAAEMFGVEIEISATGDDTHHRTHVAVRERRGSGAARYAAIYPALHAGSYTLWRPDGQPALEVTITGGAVAQAQWS